MNKTQFVEYWKDCPKTGKIASINGFVYYQYELEESDRGMYQSRGYEKVVITAKFSVDELVALSHSSHVSFITELEIEFNKAWEAAGSDEGERSIVTTH